MTRLTTPARIRRAPFLSTSPKEARYARHYCLRYVFRERFLRKIEAEVFQPRRPARQRGRVARPGAHHQLEPDHRPHPARRPAAVADRERADQLLGRRPHPGAENGVGMTLTASQADWLRVRSYLQQHRHALAVNAAGDFPAERRMAGTPLLAAPEWHPAEPVPLPHIE